SALGPGPSFDVSAAEQPQGPEVEQRWDGKKAHQARFPRALDEGIPGAGRCILLVRGIVAVGFPNQVHQASARNEDFSRALRVLRCDREADSARRLAELPRDRDQMLVRQEGLDSL